MSPDLFAAVVGAVISFIFSLVPSLNDKYQLLTRAQKIAVMAFLMAIVAIAMYGLACYSILDKIVPGAKLTCDEKGIFDLVEIFFLTLGGNQGAFMLTSANRSSGATK